MASRTRDLYAPGVRTDVRVPALAACLDRYDHLPLARVLTCIIDRVPSSALPILLDQYHVDFIPAEATDSVRRELIKNSIAWHKTKGTLGGLINILNVLFNVTLEIRERNYFVLGESKLGVDKLGLPPAPAFFLNISKLGSDCIGRDRPGKFDIDLIFTPEQAASLPMDEIARVADAMVPRRCRVNLRVRGFVLGSGRLGRDLL